MLSSVVIPSLLASLAAASPVNKRATGVTISPLERPTRCLSAIVLENGAQVLTVDCSPGVTPPGNYLWELAEGDNLSVRVAGTDFCLDAGTAANNEVIKIWQCYPGLAAQHWYLTPDDRIAITGGTACLDEGGVIQTYQCYPGNTNQAWIVKSGNGASNPTTTTNPYYIPPTSTTTYSPPSPTATLPIGGSQIKFESHPDECLTVNNGYAGIGATVVLVGCSQTPGSNLDSLQRWNITRDTPAAITLVAQTSTKLCLDAGDRFGAGNGELLKVEGCDDTSGSQQWYYTDDNHIAVYGGNQCIDVKKESGPSQTKPYGSLQDVQTWQCGNDPQQVFVTSD